MCVSKRELIYLVISSGLLEGKNARNIIDAEETQFNCKFKCKKGGKTLKERIRKILEIALNAFREEGEKMYSCNFSINFSSIERFAHTLTRKKQQRISIRAEDYSAAGVSAPPFPLLVFFHRFFPPSPAFPGYYFLLLVYNVFTHAL